MRTRISPRRCFSRGLELERVMRALKEKNDGILPLRAWNIFFPLRGICERNVVPCDAEMATTGLPHS